MEQGWSEESAIRLVSGASQTLENYKPPLSERRIETGKSLRTILWGIPLCIIGFVTFQVSSSSVWMSIGWALMLFGIVSIYNGHSAWWKSRR